MAKPLVADGRRGHCCSDRYRGLHETALKIAVRKFHPRPPHLLLLSSSVCLVVCLFVCLSFSAVLILFRLFALVARFALGFVFSPIAPPVAHKI